jgi:hypothetical protein
MGRKNMTSARRLRNRNALKHGAFAVEDVVMGEDPEEFEKLFKAYVEDLKPEGPLQTDCVRTLAICVFRKGGVRRWYNDQVNWLNKHPDAHRYDEAAWLCALIRGLPSPTDAWTLTKQLPQHYRDFIYTSIEAPRKDSGEAWLQRLRELLVIVREGDRHVATLKSTNPAFLSGRADRLFELSSRYYAILDQLDRRFDTAFKRLVMLQTYKDIRRDKHPKVVEHVSTT